MRRPSLQLHLRDPPLAQPRDARPRLVHAPQQQGRRHAVADLLAAAQEGREDRLSAHRKGTTRVYTRLDLLLLKTT